MISYKRDVLERQNLSEVKMGRGSPICERVCKKIVEYFKGDLLCPFLQDVNKSLMSPERICEILAQNTPQINFYSLLKLPLLGYEPKRADFEYVALNANELLLLEKRAELQELKLRH